MSNEIAETKETEIVVPPASAEVQTLNALTQSIATGQLQPEQLSMVLDAQERILDRQIKQAFMADMALCQADMPAVIKHGWNSHTESAYEKIDDLNNAIKPTYTKYGFAVSFNSTPSFQEGWIGMKAIVSHRLGWSEEHTYELPPDIAGIGGKVNKTVIHGTSSSRLYMRRYLLKEIFNITTSEDVDDDGNAAGGDTRSAAEINEYWINHNIEVREILGSVFHLKEAIRNNNMESTVEIWQELTDKEKSAIWSPAPTKGGILTTNERTVLKSNEFTEARNAMYGISKDNETQKTGEL